MAIPAAASQLSRFEALYREHFSFAWRSLARLGVPERDVADAVQDVFVVLHRRFALFDPATRATTWIYAVCMRVASDRRRSGRARYEVLVEPSTPIATAPEQELAAQRRALLALALDALPIEQRAVFTLFELEGLSGDEIAELLSIPAPTVHSRLRLARGVVRRVIQRENARADFELAKTGGKR